MNSLDLALCTFFDSLEEIKERLEELKEENRNRDNSGDDGKYNNQENQQQDKIFERSRADLEILQQYAHISDINSIKLREIIRGGIGNITIADVMIAESSKGKLFF